MKSIIVLMALFSVGCSYDYVLLDKSNGAPLPNVRVNASAWLKAPSVGHPAEFEIQDWQLETNESGEYSLFSFFGIEPSVSYYKQGYGRTGTPKNDNYTKIYPDKIIHYMLPLHLKYGTKNQ